MLFHDSTHFYPIDPFSQIVLPIPQNIDISTHVPNLSQDDNYDNSNPIIQPPQPNPSKSRPVRSHNPPSWLRDYNCNIVHTSCTSKSLYSIHKYLSYENVSAKLKVFSMNIYSHFKPKYYKDASKYEEWWKDM